MRINKGIVPGLFTVALVILSVDSISAADTVEDTVPVLSVEGELVQERTDKNEFLKADPEVEAETISDTGSVDVLEDKYSEKEINGDDTEVILTPSSEDNDMKEDIPDAYREYLKTDGFTYEGGKLYYHGYELDENGMYVVEEDGRKWEYDPFDPEFLNYFGDSVDDVETETAPVLSRSNSRLTGSNAFTSAINGGTYSYPAGAVGREVVCGVDVSYFQKEIDWSRLAAGGVKFAIIRAGYRGYGDVGNMKEDPMCRSYIEGAYNAGIKVGIYFFSQAMNTSEAVAEANMCDEIIRSYKGKITLPVFMDYEYTGNPGRLKKQHDADMYSGGDYRAMHNDVVNSFMNTISAKGYSTGIYCNKNMFETQLYAGSIPAQYAIWLAHYTNSTSYSGRVDYWQYTSTFDGFGSNMDLDFRFVSSNSSQGNNGTGGQSGGNNNTSIYENKASDEEIRAFVTRLYSIALGRQPDSKGLADWTDMIKTGKMSGADVTKGFYLSKEMLSHNYNNATYVEYCYKGILGRNSDPTGKAEWVAALNAGVSYTYILKGFIESKEFTNLCNKYNIVRGTVSITEARDRNIGVTKFVSRLYMQALGRKYDVGGLNNWCANIINNPGRSYIVEVVTYGFLHSQEFGNKKLKDEEYVKVLYRTFLGREYDNSGYEYWVNQLKSGKSRDEIVKGFAYSKEFNSIMAAYGL